MHAPDLPVSFIQRKNNTTVITADTGLFFLNIIISIPAHLLSYCSNLNASTGFIFAADLAGATPDIIPTNIENASANITS